MKQPTIVALLLLAPGLPAWGGLTDLELEPIVGQSFGATTLTHVGDERLIVTRLQGRVEAIDDAGGRETVIDITDRVAGEGLSGLFSVAFPPDLERHRWMFAHYVERESLDSVISRFDLRGDALIGAAESEVVLLRFPKAEPLHYGGQLHFGADGYLYVSTGDGSVQQTADPACAAQSLASFEGKLLRLDVTSAGDRPPYYTVPADNPFATGPLPEIWALGLRNPFRFSFDREQGDLWIADVGQSQREEVNRQPASSPGGENYGWKVVEGSLCFDDLSGCSETVPACNDPALTPPVLEYEHGGDRCAVIGGYVYRGSLVPDLYGQYVYGDFCAGTIWAMSDAGTITTLPVSLPGVGFGEGADGELWLLGQGSVHRLVDRSLPAGGLIEIETTRLEVHETTGLLEIGVRRLGGSEGEVRAHLEIVAQAADAGLDFYASPETPLVWASGETGSKAFPITILDDLIAETSEGLTVRLASIDGDAIAGVRTQSDVIILDDDACVSDATHLCLVDGRFEVSVQWRDRRQRSGAGQTVPLSPDAGMFWFFRQGNPEIFVKILDACDPPFERFWVFAAGLTDLETALVVTDTRSGTSRTYESVLGESYEAVRDTQAFATCP